MGLTTQPNPNLTDPKWIGLVWAVQCAGCGSSLEPGDEAYFFFGTKSAYGDACGCGDDAERDYSAQIFDEEQGLGHCY